MGMVALGIPVVAAAVAGGWIAGFLLLICFPRFLLRPLPLGPDAPSFFSEAGKRKRRILLLVAHPDDECMFFGPTLLSLAVDPNNEIQVLSISSGNADGLGEFRKLEMVASCSVLEVPEQNVEVLDDPALQDGHKHEWNQTLLVKIIKQAVQSRQIDAVITFDGHGVSGHPNHIALSRALRAFLLEANLESLQAGANAAAIEGWELVSLNIARKYSGLLEVLLSTLAWSLNSKKSDFHCFVTLNPRKSVAAMQQHKSQWVWFRKLFVVFAAYTYVNALTKISTEAGGSFKS